jgi:uncharacterized membrane protein
MVRRMITDFLRDALFTTAWSGLMTGVWLGWAQEAPPRRLRPWLIAGSVVGLVLAVGFGVAVGLNWSSPSALEGRYQWFGMLVGAEGLAAGLGCGLLAQRGRQRWMAWWVGLVVAAHFVPLAFLLSDLSIAVVGVLQVVALLALLPSLRKADNPTSATVGPVMGFSLLTYGLVTAVALALQPF